MARIAFVLALVVSVAVLGTGCGDDDGPLITPETGVMEADYSYVIPTGTWDRINAGEPVEILPDRLEVQVGEVIQIDNQDDEGHFVGIFYVGPGETVTQRFSSPGEFVGNCTVHPSGEIALVVRG